jgi:hypothetical protein
VPDALLREWIFATDIQVAAHRPDSERLDRHRLDDGERVELQDDAILERARLGLVRVAHDIVRLRLRGGNGGPLATGGKCRTAAAHQFRRRHFVDDAL